MSIVYVRKVNEERVVAIDLRDFDSLQEPEIKRLAEFYVRAKYSQPVRVIGLRYVMGKTLEDVHEPVPALFGGLKKMNMTKTRLKA